MGCIYFIKLNENTCVSIIKETEHIEGYQDKEILYEADSITMVCFDRYNLREYKKLLIKEVIRETSKEIVRLSSELCIENNKYLKLVSSII